MCGSPPPGRPTLPLPDLACRICASPLSYLPSGGACLTIARPSVGSDDGLGSGPRVRSDDEPGSVSPLWAGARFSMRSPFPPSGVHSWFVRRLVDSGSDFTPIPEKGRAARAGEHIGKVSASGVTRESRTSWQAYGKGPPPLIRRDEQDDVADTSHLQRTHWHLVTVIIIVGRTVNRWARHAGSTCGGAFGL